MAGKDSLQDLLEQTKQGISDAQTKADEAHEHLQRQKEKKAALEAMVAEITKSEQSIGKLRSEAQKELDEAPNDLASLKTQLEKPDARQSHDQIKTANDEVDQQIVTLRKKTEEAAEAVKKAEDEKRDADFEVLRGESTYQRARSKFQQLAKDITDAKTDVSTLRDSAKKAANSKQGDEAWWRVLDLEKAMKALKEQLSQGADPRDDLEIASKDLESRRDTAMIKKLELDKQRKALSEAEESLKQAKAEHDATIRQKLEEQKQKPHKDS